jgi:DNA sulfur modification protein DndD
LEFADGDHNVTVVYGANGAGKTTLLNAFRWALYGTLDADVEQPEQLVHNGVWARAQLGETVSASVTLAFDHNDHRYRLRREVCTTKQDRRQQHGEPVVSLYLTDPTGTTREMKAWSDTVEHVLPAQLAQFFFFNGERIERLVHRDAYTHIQTAIKTLLGMRQLERAIEHLPAAERRFNSELRRLGHSKLADLAEQMEATGARLRAIEVERARLRSEAAHIHDEIDKLDERLREHAATAALQARRDAAQTRQDEARQRLGRARSQRNALVCGQGYRAWAVSLLPGVEAISDRLTERGELPAPIKRQFVDELLDRGRCICGTDLTTHPDAFAAVKGWQARAGLAEVEGAWQQLRGNLKIFREACTRFTEQLRAADDDLAETTEADRNAREELSQVKAELDRLPLEDARRLEPLRNRWQARLTDTEFALRDIEREQKTADAWLQDLDKQFRDAEAHDNRAALLRARVQVSADAAAALRRILAETSEIVRRRLDQRVRDVYSRACIKDYLPELNDSFELHLWQGVGDDRALAPKSTGENQLLSLAFVGALAQLCRERVQSGDDVSLLGTVGGLYPVVMDAAFGSLDDTYQRAVARALPSMAAQVVVLTSRAQAGGVVASGLAPHVGAEYVITLHTEKKEAQPESIILGGRAYDYVVPGTDDTAAHLVRAEAT